MRVYLRTGRGSGISLGPIGLLIVGPIYLGALALFVMFWLGLMLLRVVAVGASAIIIAVEHRRAQNK